MEAIILLVIIIINLILFCVLYFLNSPLYAQLLCALAIVCCMISFLYNIYVMTNPRKEFKQYSIKVSSFEGEAIEHYEGKYNILTSNGKCVKFKDENDHLHEIYYSTGTVTVIIDELEE